jgi:hypothetical protein
VDHGSHHNRSCNSLSVSDRCSTASKRQERRSRSSLRRPGQSDRIRTSRRCHRSYQSHYMVRHHLHGDVDYAFDLCFEAHRSSVGTLRGKGRTD